jgi:nicotinamide-nucleotide amidase
MFDPAIVALAGDVLQTCRARGLKVATAESCTGGLVAGALTEIAGSSDVFERGFVTYSNQAKVELLGLDPALISNHGAVSRETAIAMAEGAIANSASGIAVSVTGIAGPGGGGPGKPVGLVHFACALRGAATIHAELRFLGQTRAAIRRQAVLEALKLLARHALAGS